jgi:hypothetical protein
MMTGEQREEFWRRLCADIERFRDTLDHCEIAINPFSGGRWRVKFTARRLTPPGVWLALSISEQTASTDEFLLAITPTYVHAGVLSEGERALIAVLFDERSGRYVLHADHGPVYEPAMVDYFARSAIAWLERM